jgi:hypothetical protein
MNDNVREAVATYRVLDAAGGEHFRRTVAEIRSILGALPEKMATTSPNERGYVHEISICGDTYEESGGSEPLHTEAGDRCWALARKNDEVGREIVRLRQHIVSLARAKAGQAAERVTDDALFAAVLALSENA